VQVIAILLYDCKGSESDPELAARALCCVPQVARLRPCKYSNPAVRHFLKIICFMIITPRLNLELTARALCCVPQVARLRPCNYPILVVGPEDGQGCCLVIGLRANVLASEAQVNAVAA
jgi:hypothetical protein